MTFASPTDDEAAPDLFRVCFVCSGNICRSPMAEVVFRDLAAKAGIGHRIASSSAGTGDWHVGEPADHRTVEALQRRGYDGATHRARQFDPDWFDQLDLVIALDRSHRRILDHWAATPEDQSKIAFLMDFAPHHGDNLDVPDPYYSDDAMFDAVLDQVEQACAGLVHQLEPALKHDPRR
ncbi:MAG: low molecular weight phosphotyrosine protein phosphatase [Microbacteriaceae bacterium]|nr:low molecular weight phosphotyrosine protein phosphatase [Microbacteriaceae bacterium]MCL2794011.1 low molecular weight phosphotyrosine protein phosphatase [Microbacteriaceae bacterium]